MKRRFFSWMSYVVVLACFGLVRSGHADSSNSAAAGFLPLDIIGSPSALSADGTVIVGLFDTAGSTSVHAFRWTEASGQVDLGVFPGADTSGATSASADGSVVVGSGFFGRLPPPWRWTAQTGMVALGAMPAGFINGHAHDVSADGTVVVGTVDAATPLFNGEPVFQPFRWTAATGMIPLGTLGGPQAQGNAVSADGAVVVGYSFIDVATHSAQHQEAFRWTAATGMVGLGGLPNVPLFGAATDTSADGSVVVGTSNVFGGGTSNLFGDGPAFRWTQQEGMVSLGDLPGGVFASSAMAVSADGSVIVGYGHDGTPSGQYGDLSAFIWDAVHGMRALRDVLLEQGSDVIGWRLSVPFGISADGRVIGGVGINPNGVPQAWLARLAATEVCAPPSIAAATATPNVIWPPNHKLVPVSVAVDATAVCGPPVCTIASIASDGPSNEGDMVITGDLTALLRAEKSGDRMGRTYTITLQCHDATGNGATQATTVRVPHDQRK